MYRSFLAIVYSFTFIHLTGAAPRTLPHQPRRGEAHQAMRVRVGRTSTPERTWPTWPMPPSILVQPQQNASFGLEVLQRTLSGLAIFKSTANNTHPGLWIRMDTVADDRWLARFTARTNVSVHETDEDIWAVVALYAELGVVEGYIQYTEDDSGANSDLSVNIATSLCAPLGAVAVSSDLVAEANAQGLRMLANASEFTYETILSRYTFNKWNMALLVTSEAAARDMAVASNALVTLNGIAEGGYGEGLDQLNVGGNVFGYGTDEHSMTMAASEHAVGLVASDHANNWAVMASGPPPPPEPFESLDVEDDGQSYYVAFVITDGDNVQWEMGDFTTDPLYYAAPRRGDIPFTWGLHISALAQTAPDMLSYFRETATANDSFVPYADSYAYMDIVEALGAADVSTYVSLRSSYSQALNLSSSVMFVEDLNGTDAQNAYTTIAEANSALQGLYMVQYSSYAAGEGELLWANRTSGRPLPVLSARISLWNNPGGPVGQFGNSTQVAENLNRWAGSSNETRPITERVAWVPVHAWSTFEAPPDADDIATDGNLGPYSSALYASRKLGSGIKLSTLDGLSKLLQNASAI